MMKDYRSGAGGIFYACPDATDTVFKPVLLFIIEDEYVQRCNLLYCLTKVRRGYNAGNGYITQRVVSIMG